MTDCEKPCPYEKEIDMLKKDAEQNRATHEKFYKRFEDMAVEQGKATTRLDSIFGMLTEIKADLCSLKERPTKRWDTVITAIIMGLVALGMSLLK